MRTMLFAVLMAVTFASGATDRSAKIYTLMEAQGLLQMWEQQMALGREQGQQQAQQMLDQMLASLVPTPELQARFREAFEEYLTALQPPWSAKDIVDVWAQKYGARFTDQEIDGLVAYYTSPLGKKDVAATQAALPEFSNHFMELSKPIMEKATQTYVERLQKAAKECGCLKK